LITDSKMQQVANIATARVSTSDNSRNGAFARAAKLSTGLSSVARLHGDRGRANGLLSGKMERKFLRRNSIRRGVTRIPWTSYSSVC
jgi:hypothetical protein